MEDFLTTREVFRPLLLGAIYDVHLDMEFSCQYTEVLYDIKVPSVSNTGLAERPSLSSLSSVARWDFCFKWYYVPMFRQLNPVLCIQGITE